MTEDAREWRDLAILATVGLVMATGRLVLMSRGENRSPARIVRDMFTGGHPVEEDDLFSETQGQEILRRLGAVETHLQNLPPERPAMPDQWYQASQREGA